MKKILIFGLVILGCVSVNAQDNYVSPETYAVNDDDVRAIYQELMTMPTGNINENIPQAQYNPETDNEKGLRATLRRIRYNHMNPYHGAKHQIKLNSQTKS